MAEKRVRSPRVSKGLSTKWPSLTVGLLTLMKLGQRCTLLNSRVSVTLSIAVDAVGWNSAQSLCVDRCIQAVERGTGCLGIFNCASLRKRQGAGSFKRIDQRLT